MSRFFKAVAALWMGLVLFSPAAPQVNAQATAACDLQLIFVVDTALIGGNAAIYNRITENVDAMLRYVSEYYRRVLPESNISYALVVTDPNGATPVQLINPISTPPIHWIELHNPPNSNNLDTVLPRVYQETQTVLKNMLKGDFNRSSFQNMSILPQSLGSKEMLTHSRRVLYYIGSGNMQETNSDMRSIASGIWSQGKFTEAYFFGTANDTGSTKAIWNEITKDPNHVFIPHIHSGATADGAYRDDTIADRFLFMYWLRSFEQLISNACGQGVINRQQQQNSLNPGGNQEWSFDVADGQAVLRVATAYDPTLTTNSISLFAPGNIPVNLNQVVRRFDQERHIIIWEIINPPPGEWRAERSAVDFYNRQETSVFGWQTLHIRTIPYNSPGHSSAEMRQGEGEVFQQASNNLPTIFRHQKMTISVSFPHGDPRINPLNNQTYGISANVELCTATCTLVDGLQINAVPTLSLPSVFNISFPVTIPASNLREINVEFIINTSLAPPNDKRSLGKFAVKYPVGTNVLLQVADITFTPVDCQRLGPNGFGIEGSVQIAAVDSALTPYISQVNWPEQITSQATLLDSAGRKLLPEPLRPDLGRSMPNERGYRLVWQKNDINLTDELYLLYEFSYPSSSSGPFFNSLCSYPVLTTS